MAEPLKGRRVAITRPLEQAAAFAAALRARGAAVGSFPLIRIARPERRDDLRQAVQALSRYDWVVFTSSNAVRAFWDELTEAGGGQAELARCRTACVGSGTAAVLEERGIHPDAVPDEFVGAEVAGAMRQVAALRGQRVLWPRARGARPTVANDLTAAGAVVDDIVAYETVSDGAGAARLRQSLGAGDVDVITFTASSAVHSFVTHVGTVPKGVIVACIGPVTARTAREQGLQVQIVPATHTIDGLVEALVAWYGENPNPR